MASWLVGTAALTLLLGVAGVLTWRRPVRVLSAVALRAGGYFPGLWSALVAAVAGILLLRELVRAGAAACTGGSAPPPDLGAAHGH